jgi:Predicted pPIWI-associating nuclease
VRHILKRLAPDADVVRCAWYTNQTDRNGGITRRQRAYYAVQGGLSDEFVKDFLELDTDAIHATLVKATDALNKFTHIEPETFQIPDAEVDWRVDQTLCALRKLLATISDCRQRIVERLEGEIDAAAAEQVLSDPLIGVDALASHFSVEEVSVSSVKVTGIDHERIHIEAHGSVDCILQFGSNSDLRRDEGAEIPQSFKFRSELFCPVDEPDELNVVEDSVGVDTTAWENARYGRDEYEE